MNIVKMNIFLKMKMYNQMTNLILKCEMNQETFINFAMKKIFIINKKNK